MAKKKVTYCGECELEFLVKHEAAAHIEVEFCPFCGGSVDREDQYSQDEDED